MIMLLAVASVPAGSALAKAKKAAAAPKTTMTWSASGLKKVSNLASFDYSTAIRNAYVKKVESYAKRNKIKVITAAVVDGMHE